MSQIVLNSVFGLLQIDQRASERAVCLENELSRDSVSSTRALNKAKAKLHIIPHMLLRKEYVTLFFFFLRYHQPHLFIDNCLSYLCSRRQTTGMVIRGIFSSQGCGMVWARVITVGFQDKLRSSRLSAEKFELPSKVMPHQRRADSETSLRHARNESCRRG
ncbi:hypothetical protein BJY00DRAFT_124782 [Aspergillus carlsbadensis]|nr:hypothetical protein BJY00DRAFT_124782 [Aspergillus carlsbadensis]